MACKEHAGGAAAGNVVEIHGALEAGDWIALRRTDELREGTLVTAKPAKAS